MRELYESAHSMFMDKLEVFIDKIEFPLSYDLTDEIREVSWGSSMMSFAVATELKETINQLHCWYGYLVDLSLWTEVLDAFEGNDRWYIRQQYVEQLAYYCMLQPSATRERFGMIATTALHQANLQLREDYNDHLDQDGKKYITRRFREEQLPILGHDYRCFQRFLQALRNLDNKSFETASRNFRNLASHGIAPRFEQGETSFVNRSVEPWSDLVKQPCGGYLPVSHPTKKAIWYGFGGTQPLTLQQVFNASWNEYLKAIKLFHSYQSLLREILTTIRSRPSELATATSETSQPTPAP